MDVVQSGTLFTVGKIFAPPPPPPPPAGLRPQTPRSAVKLLTYGDTRAPTRTQELHYHHFFSPESLNKGFGTKIQSTKIQRLFACE